MSDDSKGARKAIMAIAFADAVTGGAFSEALAKQFDRGGEKLAEPCPTCALNRKGCEDICRNATKVLYPGCDIRIKSCGAYKPIKESGNE